jgi:hypothetical protein
MNKPREWWISETWLLGDPEMKNYFVEKREPSAQFRNGAIQNYYHVIEYSAVEQLQAKLDEAVKALDWLLSDSQHADHNCGDDRCPVDNGRKVLQRIRGEE